MFILVAAVVAAAISPLGIDVVTADGHRRLVPVADLDATAVEVCAWSGDNGGWKECRRRSARRAVRSSARTPRRRGCQRRTAATGLDGRWPSPAWRHATRSPRCRQSCDFAARRRRSRFASCSTNANNAACVESSSIDATVTSRPARGDLGA